MSLQSHRRNRVFISYSHQDSHWVERVRVHLKPLERDHDIDIWDDSRIRSGSRWRDEIRSAIDSSKVAVLVVSADFLASDFITSQELPALLEAAEKDGAVILPLIVSPSRFASSETLRAFQAINDPANPLIKMSRGDQEDVLVKLASEIEAALRLETAMREHLAPAVIDELRRAPLQLDLNPQRTRVTILQSEVRGFTTLSESMAADELGHYLHSYLTAMTEIVFELKGTLDRYVGNALTAYWGAPIAYDDSAARACDAALKMLRRVEELNPMLLDSGMPPLRVSIAITTGEVIVGNIGSAQRFQYSILGEALEILSRLIYVNDQFRNDILLTEFTHQEIHREFETKMLAEQMRVKGKVAPIAVYALVGRRVGEH